MATVSAAFPCKSANPSAPQRGTTPTKITLAPLIHPAFPFENDQASQRLALNPHKPRHHRRTQTTPRFPPSRLFGRLPLCIPSRLRMAGVRKPLTKAALPVIRSSWRRGLEFVGGGLDGGGSAHRITRRRIDLRDRSEWVGPWAAGGGRTDAGGDSEAGYSSTIGSLANT